MASKASGKVKVTLVGGPFGGYSMYLGTNSTFKFSAKGYIGQYDRLGWKSEAKWVGTKIGNPLEINPNIIISTTE
jgi:hypothetical protein